MPLRRCVMIQRSLATRARDHALACAPLRRRDTSQLYTRAMHTCVRRLSSCSAGARACPGTRLRGCDAVAQGQHLRLDRLQAGQRVGVVARQQLLRLRGTARACCVSASAQAGAARGAARRGAQRCAPPPANTPASRLRPATSTRCACLAAPPAAREGRAQRSQARDARATADLGKDDVRELKLNVRRLRASLQGAARRSGAARGRRGAGATRLLGEKQCDGVQRFLQLRQLLLQPHALLQQSRLRRTRASAAAATQRAPRDDAPRASGSACARPAAS